MKEWVKGLVLAAVFVILYFAPLDAPQVAVVLSSGLRLLGEYARLHVLTCLVPAMVIAGTIAVFVKKDAVLSLLGPKANKLIAYPVASISGGILAVCSCTILPLFAGIYKRGAGIGPAVAFLFTGPAINVTAILLTTSVLGWEFALARLVSAMVISVVAGLILARAFRAHDEKNSGEAFVTGMDADVPYPNWLITVFFVGQLLVLVVLGSSFSTTLKSVVVVLLIGVLLALALTRFRRDHLGQWMFETWTLSKKILPYLFVGVFAAGMIEGLLPRQFVTDLVGGNSIGASMVASVFGAFMYFATLTEVPIVQSLLELGMGKGPALTLFLTGNSLSLPSMIVLFSIMGKRQAIAYIVIIVLLSAMAGWTFGMVAPA